MTHFRSLLALSLCLACPPVKRSASRRAKGTPPFQEDGCGIVSWATDPGPPSWSSTADRELPSYSWPRSRGSERSVPSSFTTSSGPDAPTW